MQGGQTADGMGSLIPPPPGGALDARAADGMANGGGGNTGTGSVTANGANSTALITLGSPVSALAPAPAPTGTAPPPPLAPATDRAALDLLVSAVSDGESKKLAVKAITSATVARFIAVLADTYGQGEYGTAWRLKLQLPHKREIPLQLYYCARGPSM